jgi:hypothetical protein
MRATWLSFAALAVVAGCASVLDVRDPSLEWCLRPENAHAFCEDFDHPNPLVAWSIQPNPPQGAERSVLPSNDSPPNLLDTRVEALSSGASNLTGLETAFQGETFNHVVVSVDVRVVAANFVSMGDISSGIGFLLIEDTSPAASQPNLCIGLELAPGSTMASVAVALVLVPNPSDCFMVDNMMTMDAGGTGDDASDQGAANSPPIFPLREILANNWQHIVLDIVRDSSGDGSGSVQPTLSGVGAIPLALVPAGFLSPGYPQLGIATSVTGPSGNVEIQFDNVTVDFPSN